LLKKIFSIYLEKDVFFFILQESDVAKHLRMMLMALSFPKPPANITGFQMFSKVENKVVL
jgi:hypothetical protein